MSKAQRGRFRTGTSGYQYDHWKGIFYPTRIPKKDWFRYYASQFDTVEINNTFYQLPEAGTFDSWREQAPDGFLYVLKFSRYGSHLKKLKNPEDSIGAFLERADRLGSHLGPILVQLPPGWKVNVGRLAAFLEAAPRRYRWAVEFRDPSWLCEEIFEILQDRNAALCVHDKIECHPRPQVADWVYLRYHGDRYHGSYTPQKLIAEARRIKRSLSDGKDVYAYFNNDLEGYAVENARDLHRYVLGN